jgi:hypothetical protein
MNKKAKGVFSIIYMSVSAYMMVTTKYSRALGDYVLEFIGLKSWTGDYSGTHLTIFYFGILFLVGLFLVKRYAIVGLNMKGRSIFIIFIVFILGFSSITGIAAKTIKRHSPGLLSIAYHPSNGNMKYRTENEKLVEFTAEFALTNYSKEKKTFHIAIDSDSSREAGIDEINFYNIDGKPASFYLEGNETKVFLLSLDDYIIVGGNGSGSGIVEEIILYNNRDNCIRLVYNNFSGIEIGR